MHTEGTKHELDSILKKMNMDYIKYWQNGKVEIARGDDVRNFESWDEFLNGSQISVGTVVEFKMSDMIMMGSIREIKDGRAFVDVWMKDGEKFGPFLYSTDLVNCDVWYGRTQIKLPLYGWRGEGGPGDNQEKKR